MSYQNYFQLSLTEGGGDTHYVGVFTTFSLRNTKGYRKLLLGFLPMENEESQAADEY